MRTFIIHPSANQSCPTVSWSPHSQSADRHDMVPHDQKHMKHLKEQSDIFCINSSLVSCFLQLEL